MEDIKETVKRWKSLYPAYINGKLTIDQGRRVPKAKAIDNPTCHEMAEILQYLKIPCVIEVEKAYPKDWTQKGRVKFMLKDEDGNLRNPEIINSILYLKNRTKINVEILRINTKAKIKSRRCRSNSRRR